MIARFLLVMLFVVGSGALRGDDAPKVKFVTPRGGRDPGLWGKFEDAPATDGKIRLRAVWVRGSPAREIVSESGTFRLSDKKGWTFEFYVMLENVSREVIEVPSIVDQSPRSSGMPIDGGMIVPYLVQFPESLGDYRFVMSPVAFRPVKLKPGEVMRLPIYYRVTEALEAHWFFYAVDDVIAKRYGWWSGALRCKGEEYLPNKAPEPTP